MFYFFYFYLKRTVKAKIRVFSFLMFSATLRIVQYFGKYTAVIEPYSVADTVSLTRSEAGLIRNSTKN